MLKLDGRDYSPLVLQQIVMAGAAVTSYKGAASILKLLAEVDVSARHVNNLTTMIGEEFAAACHEQTEAYQSQPLPRTPTRPETPIALACVQCDGGRMQTREANRGRGVHDAHWRETKNAGFFRMKTQSHVKDPHPELPRCFANRNHMSKRIDGLSAPDEAAAMIRQTSPPTEHWRPEVLFRTCISSLDDSESFGWMMAAEADARGFYAAQRRAFLGDGQAYNWTIQQARFPTFEPILDFIHPLEHLHEAAASLCEDGDAAWEMFRDWAVLAWQGRADVLLDRLRESLEGVADEEVREAVRGTLTYLEHNQSRMDYPRYRRDGLPTTSSLIESQIKEMNHRVKGTEKFWNDNDRGAAILFIRAALLCHDDRLEKHLRNRSGSPYARSRPNPTSIAA